MPPLLLSRSTEVSKPSARAPQCRAASKQSWCVSDKPKKYESQDNCMYRHVFWAWMKQISRVGIWRGSFFSYFMRVVFEKHPTVDSKPTVQAFMSNLSEASSQTQPTAATHLEQSHAIPHRSKKIFTGRGQCHPSAFLWFNPQCKIL
jgi:hypothetical protein